jgi:hypothetical protein
VVLTVKEARMPKRKAAPHDGGNQTPGKGQRGGSMDVDSDGIDLDDEAALQVQDEADAADDDPTVAEGGWERPIENGPGVTSRSGRQLG